MKASSERFAIAALDIKRKGLEKEINTLKHEKEELLFNFSEAHNKNVKCEKVLKRAIPVLQEWAEYTDYKESVKVGVLITKMESLIRKF